jgi:outer membrane protein assembly factor BamB
MYLAYRTSSVIVRFRIDEHGEPVRPIRGQLLARFDPYDRETGRSADLTDMTIDDRGRLYVVSAKPARIYRFTPDPARIFDARDERTAPWADLARLTGNAAMKSENVLYHGGWLYVTSGDGYDYQDGADGTVYRIRVPDA